MKLLGIIAEYNPFHNGHFYQLQKAKQMTKADAVVVIMSGNFVQRGEPAILDKWTRTHMALCSGADIVIELPVLYATASAEYFAYGAVKLLDEIGITDICFGSELGEIKPLQQIAQLLLEEPESFRKLLKQALESGISYASARSFALAQFYPAAKDILFQSNNILAVEYLKSLLKLNSAIRPHTIARKGSAYHDITLQPMASATALRNAISQNHVKEIKEQIPPQCYAILQQNIAQGKAPIFLEHFTEAFHYCIRTHSPESIKNIFEVKEGLENRIYKAFDTNYDINSIISFIKSKRYTQTHIQRMLLHILLQIQTQDIHLFCQSPSPSYIRISSRKTAPIIHL